MKLPNLSIYIVCIISGLAGGFCLLLFLIFKGLAFSNQISLQIDPVNFISLITTVLLAIYVTRELSTQNEEERVEKDLIIQDVRDFKKNIIKDIRRILNQATIEHSYVVERIKILRMSLNCIVTLIRKHKYTTDEASLTKLENKIRDIKDLLTDTPMSSSTGTPDISVSGGLIRLEPIRKEKIETTLAEINNDIFELVVEINKK